MATIFTQIHTDRDGNETPLVSMDAEHLVNTVNFFFRKLLENARKKVMREFGEQFAPPEMDAKQRRALGLRELTPEIEADIEQRIDEGLNMLLHRVIDEKWPYIIVGICRDDTRDGVVAILQDVFGITGKIDLPGLTHSAQEISLLNDGFSRDDEYYLDGIEPDLDW